MSDIAPKTTKTNRAQVATVTIAGQKFQGVMFPDGSYGITIQQAATVLGIEAHGRNAASNLKRFCERFGIPWGPVMEHVQDKSHKQGVFSLECCALMLDRATVLRHIQRRRIERQKRESMLKTYLITDIDRGVCKVGQSMDPWQRLREIQTGYPYPLTLAFMVPSSALSEREAHNVLKPLRLNGEWFKLTPYQYVMFHEAVSQEALPCSGSILTDQTGLRMGLRSNGKDPFIETTSLELSLGLPFGTFSGSTKAYLIGAEDLDHPSTTPVASQFLVINNGDAVEIARSLDWIVTHTIVDTLRRVHPAINLAWDRIYLETLV